MTRIKYDHCPACSSSTIEKKITAVDHTVSRETYEIWECAVCTLRFTQDIPGPDSIGHYYQSANYISHTDTKKGLVNSLYHVVRKRTLRHKQQLIEKITGVTKGKLLDIGAGTGAFSSYMKNAGWEVVGLEPDEATRNRANALYGISLQTSSDLFQLAPGTFDAITMWHVLEHVHSLHEYFDQVRTILKPGGKAFVAVPNYTSFDAQVYQSYWAAYDVPRHLYHFSPSSMKQVIEKHGMILDQLKPMWYDSFYVSMLSEQYKNGHPGNLNAFRNGLLSNMKAGGNYEKCSSVIYVLGRGK